MKLNDLFKFGDSTFGTGLEAEKAELYIALSLQTPFNVQAELSEEQLREIIESKLSQNGIKVLKKFDSTSEIYLDVKVRILLAESVTPYDINIGVPREIEYTFQNKTYLKQNNVWSRSVLGYGDKNELIKALKEYIDLFIEEFKLANSF